MVTLGLICLFLSFVLVIMGLIAWGSTTSESPTNEEPNVAETNEEPRG